MNSTKNHTELRVERAQEADENLGLDVHVLLSGKRLSRNVVYGMAGQVVPFVVGIFAVRLLINYLGTSRFGVLTLIWALIGYFGLFDLGIGRAVTKRMAEKIGEHNSDEIIPLFWTSLVILFSLGVIGGIVLFVASDYLVGSVLKVPPEFVGETLHAFSLTSFAIPIVVATTGLRGTLEARQLFGKTSTIQSGTGIFMLVAPLVVLPFTSSLAWIVFALILGRVLGMGAYGFFCLREVPALRQSMRITKKAFVSLWNFSIWIAITNVVAPVMVYFDRFLIGALLSVSMVAFYTTPFDVVSKLWFVPNGLVAVLFPAFSMSYASNRDRCSRLFTKGFKYALFALLPLVSLVIVFAREALSLWLGEPFALESYRVAQVLAVGILVNSVGYVPSAFLQGIGRPDLTTKLGLLELPFYLVAVYFGAKQFGIVGVAMAWTLRVSLDVPILLYLSKRNLEEIQIPFREMTLAILATAVAGILAWIAIHPFEKLAIVTVLFSAMFLVIWSRLLDTDERQFIHRRWRDLVRVLGLEPQVEE